MTVIRKKKEQLGTFFRYSWEDQCFAAGVDWRMIWDVYVGKKLSHYAQVTIWDMARGMAGEPIDEEIFESKSQALEYLRDRLREDQDE